MISYYHSIWTDISSGLYPDCLSFLALSFHELWLEDRRERLGRLYRLQRLERLGNALEFDSFASSRGLLVQSTALVVYALLSCFGGMVFHLGLSNHSKWPNCSSNLSANQILRSHRLHGLRDSIVGLDPDAPPRPSSPRRIVAIDQNFNLNHAIIHLRRWDFVLHCCWHGGVDRRSR